MKHHETAVTLAEALLAVGPYLIVLGTRLLDRRKSKTTQKH